MSRAQCRLCGAKVESAEPEPDGRWHDSMKVALRAAMRRIK